MIKPLVQKVLVAYNGSESSLNAVLYAIMMSKAIKCSVKVLYVVDTASIKQLLLSKFIVADEAENMTKRLYSDGERNMEYVKKLSESKGVKLETQITEGTVWSELILKADEYKADLILLGGTTSSKTSQTLKKDKISLQDSEILGSAHCSVMVVREPYVRELFKLS